jgi:hypothetical protein
VNYFLVRIMMFWKKKQKNIPEALVSFDFRQSFPHKYWISTWAKDESYPKGFRYKLLTVHNEQENMIEMVLVLEEPGGLKDEMKRMKVSPSAVDRTCAIFTDGLAEEHGVQFDELDLSTVRSAKEFEQRVTEAGWYQWQP